MTKVAGYKRDLYIQLFKKKKQKKSHFCASRKKTKNGTFSIRGTFTESPHNDFEMRTD